ncbi:hypothetical protein [Thiofaba sp. EF100]|uniref:hypothetical protein n=1 Tax=Thiofaba sp. EF100 TaxID=3121274 RepID=UPI0032218538
MSEAITLDTFRARLAAAVAGESACPVVTHMAFGRGGHNHDGTARPVAASRTTLFDERLRKTAASIDRPSPTEVRVKGVITEAELNGETISEAALVDASGQLIAMKTFAPKVKESDERIEITLTLRF